MKILSSIGKLCLIVMAIILLFGAFLFISEDVCGYTPHLYFTKYHR